MQQADIFLAMLANISSPTQCPDQYATEYATEYKVEALGDGGLWVYAKFEDGSEADAIIED